MRYLLVSICIIFTALPLFAYFRVEGSKIYFSEGMYDYILVQEANYNALTGKYRFTDYSDIEKVECRKDGTEFRIYKKNSVWYMKYSYHYRQYSLELLSPNIDKSEWEIIYDKYPPDKLNDKYSPDLMNVKEKAK